jgi:dipeptidase D
VDDDWVLAEGTTLGADNGIGVASALAVPDTGCEHGPLELLFTVSEEQGLDGAKGLDASLVGGRLLLNLDGTSDDALTVGCAGSDHTLLHLPLSLGPVPDGWTARRMTLSGPRGGHSGGDIATGRVNAIKALGRVGASAFARTPFGLVTLDGGVSRNAIPREATAVIACPVERTDALMAAASDELEAIAHQYAATDGTLDLRVVEVPVEVAASEDAARRVLDVIAAIPTGVLAMSSTLPGLVETSTSLTVARTEGGTVTLASMARSSNAVALDELKARMEALARLAGAEIEVRRSYPPWEPDLDSALLRAARATFARLFGAEPGLTVVHGGLECAVLGQKLPGVQMISIGPEVVGPHAPGEMVRISSVQRFYRLLVSLLDDLSR